jgi:hypothetical protein
MKYVISISKTRPFENDLFFKYHALLYFWGKTVYYQSDNFSLFSQFMFYFLLSHYTHNTLQLYLAGQCQSLPISIIKH